MSRIDQGQLFEEYGLWLHAVVSQQVRTWQVSVEDACRFAWLQLVRRRPRYATAFAWLWTTAIKEATKLYQRTSQTVRLDEVTTSPRTPPRIRRSARADRCRRGGQTGAASPAAGAAHESAGRGLQRRADVREPAPPRAGVGVSSPPEGRQ